ncbi:MAG: hydrogenase [Lachnospiraceae bacterium]|nr:hydrogenase [Lachnospiraceae bacterium]
MSKIIEQPRYACALATQQSVLAIPRAIPILHSGPGCSNKIGAIRTYAGWQGEGYAGGGHIPCTNSTESDIVFGGIKKLRNTIDGALKVMDGDLFVVITGCTADIVGDDVPSVVYEYQEQGYPIINIETGGFKGNNYFGHNLLLKEMVQTFLKGKTPNKKKGLVNVFSVIPFQDPFWRGDLSEIKRLLASIGLETNILFGNESAGIKEWEALPDAEFTLVLNPWVGLDAAKLLEKRFGVPYLHIPVLPVGAEATSEFLRTVASFAEIDPEVVEAVIAKEEERFYSYFTDAADFFTETRNGLPYELYTIADSAYGIGASKFLIRELGFAPKRAFVIENVPQKYRTLVEQAFLDIDEEYADHIHFEEDGGAIEARIAGDENRPQKTLILGSQWENDIAQKLEAPITHLSMPIMESLIMNKTYLGYAGGLRLLEDIYSNILSNKDYTYRFRDKVAI